MINLKPLNGYCVLKPVKADKTTKSGIIIPDTAEGEKPQEGEVVAVAETNLSQDGGALPIEIKVGDKVLFGRYSGEDVEHDGEEYKIVEFQFVRAIIT